MSSLIHSSVLSSRKILINQRELLHQLPTLSVLNFNPIFSIQVFLNYFIDTTDSDSDASFSASKLKPKSKAAAKAKYSDYENSFGPSVPKPKLKAVQKFVGSNNFNLLFPSGQFGTRLQVTSVLN